METELVKLVEETGKLLIDVAALSLSIYAVILSRETDRRVFVQTVRSQLAETITKIFAADVAQKEADADVAKLRRVLDNRSSETAQPDREIEHQEAEARVKRNTLRDQKLALADQVRFLLDQLAERRKQDGTIPELVSGTEYTALARALEGLLPDEAEQYWKNAMRTGKGLYGAVVARWYGQFLFERRNNFEDGRRIYQEAIDGIGKMVKSDAAWWEKMWVYLEWARSEARHWKPSDPTHHDPQELMKLAGDACEQIQDPGQRAEGQKHYISKRDEEIKKLMTKTQ